MALSTVHRVVWKVAMDTAALLLVGVAVLAFPKVATLPKVGFHCGDYSIHYPYKDSTVPTLLIGGICLLSPILLMVAVETVRFWRCKRSYYLPARLRIGKVDVHPLFLEVVHLVAVFLFGAGCSQLATDIGKYSIGRLRPHFIAVCNPDMDLLCPSSVPPTKYITDFQCRGEDQHRLKDARLSFPSGHASFSAYTMFYLAIYLQARMTWNGSKLFRPFLQAIAFGLFWFTALSRVSDYKHHWSDVLAGGVLGLTVAALTAKYISHLFVARRLPEEIECETKMEHMNGSHVHRSVPSSSECSPTKSTLVENLA